MIICQREFGAGVRPFIDDFYLELVGDARREKMYSIQ
jgi:hypothetical protein